MPFKYESGEEIKKGDHVTFHGEPGEIEFVADPLFNDPETDCYAKELGDGVMIIEPEHFGHAFLLEADTYEDLVFVSRSN